MPKVNNKALEISKQTMEKRRSSGNAAGMLIGTNTLASFRDDDSLVPVRLIELDKIKERDINEFKLVNIPQLAESIKSYGLIDPISVVHEVGNPDLYTIVSGHRRFEAFKLLNNSFPNEDEYKKIPAAVYELTNDPNELAQGLPYIDSIAEESMYLEANLQSRQLTYGEVAHQIRKIVKKLENPDYFNRLNLIVQENKYSIIRNGRIKLILSLLSSYSYKGWQRETIRRYLKLYDAVKDGTINENVLDDIELGNITVKVAYDKYFSTNSISNTTKSKKYITRINETIKSINNEIKKHPLTNDEKNELKQCIKELSMFIE